jgi:predicted metalloprotease with PDZ domain
MFKTIVILVITILSYSASFAQHPLHHFSDAGKMRFSTSQPIINYIIRVDTLNLSVIKIEMHARNTPDTFRVAMVAHPEYDDRYWQFVEDFRAETSKNNGNILREDSALWRVVAPGGEVILRYTIHLPPSPTQRATWRPFLSSTGGLIGGPQSFMYIVGATLAPSHVVLQLPEGWNSATGLEPTADPHTFFAPDIAVLVDCPILVGHFNSWQFSVDAVPHRVLYWPTQKAKSFDTIMLVSSIEKMVRQAGKLFGRIPYSEYSFLIQDDAYGALEHSNSVTIGAPAGQLDKNFNDYIFEIAHEYFHTWNLVRIRPAEWGDVSYKTPKLSRGLWWSEGLTMLYADLLIRRAGLPAEESSRIQHLEKIIRLYFSNSGNYLVSPENISMAENGPPGFAGDYMGSPHVQGELLGTMLDINIRSNTNGKYSIDDVMRKMFERFSGENGFTGKDVEVTVRDVCRCDVHSFFERYVRGKKQIDFNKYLQRIGLHMDLTWKQATDDSGKEAPDLRVYAWQTRKATMSLGIMDPLSCWGKALLHTNDQLMSMNGTLIKNISDFRTIVQKLKIGDTVQVEVKRSVILYKTAVVIGGYDVPVVNLSLSANASVLYRRLGEDWAKGK